jgi:hypothetical protein
MVLLVVEEAVAVRDQILKIANLGHVNRGVVNLSNDSIPNRKPNSARGRVRGPDAILASSSPSRFNAGLDESNAVTAKLCNCQFTPLQTATLALNPGSLTGRQPAWHETQNEAGSSAGVTTSVRDSQLSK